MKQRHAIQQGSLLDIPNTERKECMPSQPEIEKKMSRLEELIAELCPDGVEYKNLGKITTILRGVRVVKSQLNDTGAYPVYQNSMTPLGYYEKSNCPANTTFIIAAGAAGKIGYSPVKFWAADDCFYIDCSIDLNSRYVYYALLCQQKYIDSRVRLASIPRLSRSVVENIYIPVPPLPIQEEIVRILDKFTELTAELTAELTKRKQQYQYYRTKLFTYCDNIEVVPLKEWAINYDSKRKPVTKGNREAGIYPYYGASGIVDYVKDYIFDGDFLLISEDGANLLARNTPIAFSIAGKSWVNNHAHILKFDNIILQKYVEIYLNSIDLTKYISTAAQPKLTQDNLNKIMIPKPNYQEIKRIVSILDRFDALCNDLTSGLPAEIAARKKQYEYYRDKLLSFPEKPSTRS